MKFKKICSLFCIGLLLSFSALLFCGCTHKTYHLAGIVDPKTSAVTPIANADEETKAYIKDTLGNDPTITLKQNGKFIIEYSIVETGLEITYKQTGTFKINEEERTITFSFPKKGGGTNDTVHQYENGKIVYFDGVNFLLFN